MTTPDSAQPDSLAAFLRLFEFEKRPDLEKYCRDLVVPSMTSRSSSLRARPAWSLSAT